MPLSDSQLAKLQELFKRKAAARDTKMPVIKQDVSMDGGTLGYSNPDGLVVIGSGVNKYSDKDKAKIILHELQHQKQFQHPEVTNEKVNARQKLMHVTEEKGPGHLMRPDVDAISTDLEDAMQQNTRDNLKAMEREGRNKIKEETDKAPRLQQIIQRVMYGKEKMPPMQDIDKMMDTQRENIGVEKVKATFEEKLKEAMSTKEDDEQKAEYIKRLKEKLK